MIVNSDFVPLGSIYTYFIDELRPRFRKEWSEGTFAKKAITEGNFSKDILRDQFINFQSQEEVNLAIETLFLDFIRNSDIFISLSGFTYRCSNEIFTTIHRFSFEEEFWDIDLNDYDNYNLDLELIRDWLALPSFFGDLYLFLDPKSWAVDVRAFEAVRRRIAQVIDPIEYAVWLGSLEDPTDDELDVSDNMRPWTAWGKAKEMIENGEIDDHFVPNIQDVSETQLMYFREYSFPFLQNFKIEAVKNFSGGALCLKEDDWTGRRSTILEYSLSDAKQLSVVKRGRKPELSAKHVGGMRLEVRARKLLSEFLKENEWSGTLTELRNKVPFDLGERPWRRVVDELRKDFPTISSPGRRGAKNPTP